MTVARTRLKGGSLSGTWLLEEGGGKKVRKEVSLSQNREYGYIRWHSQLKRLQRFGALFPGVFPEVVEVGLQDDHAYFDLAYVEGSVSGFDFLAVDPGESEVRAYHDALVATMDRLHQVRRPASVRALELYLYEEMERPLAICAEDEAFREFLSHDTVVLNGVEVPSLLRMLPRLYDLGARSYRDGWECYTHGNLTLENTLWVSGEQRIWFIDPYEENIADTSYNEYSQVLQSCRSLYELCNLGSPRVEGNRVTLDVTPPPALRLFNRLFEQTLADRLSSDERRLVSLYEVTQFTRMLPFKLQIAREKMTFFYALAARLAHELLEGCHG